jgi:hypothetical protein
VSGDGAVLSWGFGEEGQLGINAEENRHLPTPLAVLGKRRVLCLALGGTHTVAVASRALTVAQLGLQVRV